MNIYLNQNQWTLKGYWPWVPLNNKEIGKGIEAMGVTQWIPATIPGGVHYDLYRAGLIEQPHKDINSIKCEWVENRWWAYKTCFNKPDITGQKIELIFKGLDYSAMIYLNDEFLGEHEGMYELVTFDITELVRENNQIIVLFKNVPQEMSQIGKTSLTTTQKSRFNYKWDFSTRMVNIGIWNDVLLKVHKSSSLGDVYLTTDVDVKEKSGLIKADIEVISHNISSEINSMKLKTICRTSDGSIAAQKEVQAILGNQQIILEIGDARLWYPNGYGDQPLYSIEIILIGNDDVLDSQNYKTGIRKLEYSRNDKSPEDSLPYTFVINGEKIYVRGFNMVPLDHMYGNVNEGHYEQIIEAMKHTNANLVRVWGGGIIEKEIFYELCDKNGILIWQEFIQSSSGIDNIPSKRPEFLELLKKTAKTALKEKRNHVSLTVWSGGNELMSEWDKPSNYEDENIAMLKELVGKMDSQRLFLPTSASGPSEFITKDKGVSHDVHGQWTYQGNPEHYKLYSGSDSLFHSEFGVDGVSCVKSLSKFLSEQYLKPVSMMESLVWRHHGEWWDTLERDRNFFGEILGISEFSDCSQWIQAEGLRFIVEANRRRQFNNSGSIIWQFNEPWPNTSCTCVMDYYGEAKMAYYWVKNAYEPVAASLDYKKLDYGIGDTFEAGVYLACNSVLSKASVAVLVYSINGELLLEKKFDTGAREHELVDLGNISFEVTKSYQELFFVRLRTIVDGVLRPENMYVFSTRSELMYSSARNLKGAKLEITTLEEGNKCECSVGSTNTIKLSYSVKNTGWAAALHVRAYEATDAYWITADNNFFTIFPGEEINVTISCKRKCAAGFLSEYTGEDSCDPQIGFRCFGDM